MSKSLKNVSELLGSPMSYSASDLRSRSRLIFATNRNAYYISRYDAITYTSFRKDKYSDFIESSDSFIFSSLGKFESRSGYVTLTTFSGNVNVPAYNFYHTSLEVNDSEDKNLIIENEVNYLPRPLNSSITVNGILSFRYLNENMPDVNAEARYMLMNSVFREQKFVLMRPIYSYWAFNANTLTSVKSLDLNPSLQKESKQQNDFARYLSANLQKDLADIINSKEFNEAREVLMINRQYTSESADNALLKEIFTVLSVGIYKSITDPVPNSSDPGVYMVFNTQFSLAQRNGKVFKNGIIIDPVKLRDQVSKLLIRGFDNISVNSSLAQDAQKSINNLWSLCSLTFKKKDGFCSLLLYYIITSTLKNCNFVFPHESMNLNRIMTIRHSDAYVDFTDIAGVALYDYVNNVVQSYSNIGNVTFDQDARGFAMLLTKHLTGLSVNIKEIENSILDVWETQRLMVMNAYREAGVFLYSGDSQIENHINTLSSYANYDFWIDEPKFLTQRKIEFVEYAKTNNVEQMVSDKTESSTTESKQRINGFMSRMQMYSNIFNKFTLSDVEELIDEQLIYVENNAGHNQPMLYALNQRPFSGGVLSFYKLNKSHVNIFTDPEERNKFADIYSIKAVNAYEKLFNNNFNESVLTDEEKVLVRQVINANYLAGNTVFSIDVPEANVFGAMVRSAPDMCNPELINSLRAEALMACAETIKDLDISSKSDAFYGTAFRVKLDPKLLIIYAKLKCKTKLVPINFNEKDSTMFVSGPLRLIYKIENPIFNRSYKDNNQIRLSKGLRQSNYTYSPIFALMSAKMTEKRKVKNVVAVDTSKLIKEFDYKSVQKVKSNFDFMSLLPVVPQDDLLKRTVQLVYPDVGLKDDTIDITYRQLIKTPTAVLYVDTNSIALLSAYENTRMYLEDIREYQLVFNNFKTVFANNSRLTLSNDGLGTIRSSVLTYGMKFKLPNIQETIDSIVRDSLTNAQIVDGMSESDGELIEQITSSYMDSTSVSRNLLYKDIASEITTRMLSNLCNVYEQRYISKTNMSDLIANVNEYRRYVENTYTRGIFVDVAQNNLLDENERQLIATEIINDEEATNYEFRIIK